MQHMLSINQLIHVNTDGKHVCTMAEKLVEHLWKAARAIPANSKCSGILTTHLLLKMKGIEENSATLKLPKIMSKPGIACKFCLNPWNDREHDMGIVPRKRLKRSVRKILRRNERDPASLREFEKKFLSRIHNRNVLKLTCSVCKKTSEVPLADKPLPALPAQPEEPPIISKKKKKKKAKDKLCGLKMSLVGQQGKTRDMTSQQPKAPIVTQPLPIVTHKPPKRSKFVLAYQPPKPVKVDPVSQQPYESRRSKKLRHTRQEVIKKILNKPKRAPTGLKDFLSSL